MTRIGVSGAWHAIELNQKSKPACSKPILIFHNNMYTALLDMKNCKNEIKIYQLKSIYNVDKRKERERERERERVSSLKPYLMSIVIHCLSSKVPGRKSNV